MYWPCANAAEEDADYTACDESYDQCYDTYINADYSDAVEVVAARVAADKACDDESYECYVAKEEMADGPEKDAATIACDNALPACYVVARDDWTAAFAAVNAAAAEEAAAAAEEAAAAAEEAADEDPCA